MKNVLKKLAFAVSVLAISAALTACSEGSGQQEDVNSAAAKSIEITTKSETTDNGTKTVIEAETEKTAEPTLEIVEPDTEDFEFIENNGEITIKNIKATQKLSVYPAR